ncbi:MSCRAMM family protein [Clostridium porci]|uniref:Cna protein B-type domain protein n=1 Tax=Clostridium porci TaxID=2605778 RepID=A0A7X2NKC1_9CLOT|nr:SpaA isopeptide-forming pilin-related protein [Clostridium porci]MSS36527.1 hypothetical protein [Clostridium porci]
MLLKTKAKRMICSVLSAAMLLSNTAGAMTAYAVGPNPPMNPDGTIPNGNKPQDEIRTEGTYINDTPLRLQVSKVKTEQGGHEGIAPDATDATQENTITYQISGRVNGTATELLQKYGADKVELAYGNNGVYLGYGWLKGTLEYLLNRQAQNLDEEIQILYNANGVFEGYAYVTRKLETAEDVNRYVAGAKMALYDAVEIFRDPSITNDGEDYGEDERFRGVTIERMDGSNNVASAYVQKGYAGNKVMYVLQKNDGSKVEMDGQGNVINHNYDYQDEINDAGDGVWIAQTVQRGDTPILFYSMDDLEITTNDVYEDGKKVDDVFGAERPNKGKIVYGFDKEGNVVDITQWNERDFSIFAFPSNSSTPVYEFVGGDFSKIRYNEHEKRIKVGKDTVIYHLDKDGNRDSMVDPQTGIAYIEEAIEPKEGHDNIHGGNDTDSTKDAKIFVWPVNVFYDGSGASAGNEKGSRTFQKIMTTRVATFNAYTANEHTTGTYDSESNRFEKKMNPVLDQYGHPVYYRQSDETYVKGEDRFDYDGDEYLGYVYKDSLDDDNENAYTINDHDTLYNGDKDDPFDQSTHYQYGSKLEVKVMVDLNGNYIVNGKNTVPTPVRPGYVFGGWLVEPDRLEANGLVAKAEWQNKNGSGMPDDERNQWYSEQEATGTTKTLTVTFDANGGEFRHGSGDIHSTDNILYRRLGDAFLIENIWTTGENTPNDPLDVQNVDTVGNTADGNNTISADGKTGNDVYSDHTTSGGQADMLKRVNAGHYIMEELQAPDGFVKALPVGVTMNEHTNVQYAEMTDTTIKAEFVKVDATESYDKNLYIDGVLQKNSNGQNVTVKETKGQYSFVHVKGATMALRGRDEKTKSAFSDWVKVTAHSGIEKQQENGVYYITFSSDVPLFLEGIPAGNYVISEEKTPAGMVQMPDKNITITESDSVHFFAMADDHTKLEIEKYYKDGENKKHLPNAYRAELSLTDANGALVASWNTDDISDYTNEIADKQTKTLWQKFTGLFGREERPTSFVEAFTEQVKNGKTDFNQMSWKVLREAVMASGSTEDNEVWILSDGSRVTCYKNTAPDQAPEGFKEAYDGRNPEENSFTYTITMTATKDEAASRTLSDQIWNVSNGSKMHISIYPMNETNHAGRQAYGVSFGFNYRNDYSGEYARMVSYDTIDGRHRFDYIPEKDYILKETRVPEGFVAAEDKRITVDKHGDVQRYTLENKKKQLVVAKLAQKDNVFYAGNKDNTAVTDPDIAKAAVIPGAELSLYYSSTPVANYKEAFANGNVPAGVTLADRFVSGNDGKYTEADFRAEKIREDQIGDYKPHTVFNLQNGFYYLTETKVPAYYAPIEPEEIQVTDLTTADQLTGMTVINMPQILEVKVHKITATDEHAPLSGAIFSIKNKTLGGVEVGTIITGNDGYGTLNVKDLGRFTAGGQIEPYTFTIEETSAPAGYQLDPTVHEFTAAQNGSGHVTIMVNPKDASIKNGVLTVTNEPSELTISKKDFQNGGAVPGTVLKVYEAVQEDGTWKSNGVSLNDTWTWEVKKNERTHSISGLTAGQAYVLREERVPAGYTKADDIFFRVSSTGRSIDKIWYDDKEVINIEFKTDSTDAVESVTFTTRKVEASTITLEDLDVEGAIENIGMLEDGTVTLTSKNITDGHTYRMNEYVQYSDGNVDRLSTTTFIGKLYNGEMVLDLHHAVRDLTVDITDSNDKAILHFTPDNNGSYTVANPLVSDPNSLTVVKKVGANHAAVQKKDRIQYEISYTGAGQEIVLFADKHLNYFSTKGFEKDEDGNFRATTTEESGTYTVIATVTGKAGYIDQQVNIGDRMYQYINPIAVNQGSGSFEDSSKLVVSSAVEGTHLDNKNAAFVFKIKLTDESGAPLTGIYGYVTKNASNSGRFAATEKETEFTVTLYGNDFVVIHDLPYNTKYSVVQVVPEDYQFVVSNTKPDGKTSNTAVSNVLFTNTRNENSERTPFEKNTDYVLTEHLNFTDDSELVLNKFGFAFGEKCEIKDITMFNKPTEVWFTKTDWATSEEVEGALCQLMDERGNVLTDALGNKMEWVSTKEPRKFVGVLEAGKTYRYHEELAPEGYGYSADVIFTVSEDGVVDKVIMQDKPTAISFTKEDFGGKEVPGASLELKKINSNGTTTTIESWVSGTKPHELAGKLTGDTTYLYHEVKAPDGYLVSEDIQFTLDEDGKVTDAHYVNKNRETILYDADGFTTTIVKHQDGTYTDNGVTITIDKNGNAVDAEGNIHAKGVKEQIPVTGNVIRMKDAPTKVVFRKTDQKTGTSLAGATLELYKCPKKEPYAEYDPADKVAEWVTDETGEFRFDGKLIPGATYTLRESRTVDGYYYSYDIEFVVNSDGKEQVVEMQNRRIIVEVPPDELPDPTPDPEGKEPNYEMEKERVTEAPEKGETGKYGFFAGDIVTYDVTITNTGSTRLTMNVSDAFENESYFSQPLVVAVKYYARANDRLSSKMGTTHSINGSVANITIEQGGYAVVTYEAEVLETAPENLSDSAPDDGKGYVNTARTYDVVGKYYEYSGEDHDGDGKGDEKTEVEIHDHPNLEDKEDDANTPVQKPEEDTPRYTMSKSRPTPAPEKENEDRYGFKRGDTVTYEVRIRNTGDMALKMYVSDEFDYGIRSYFEDLKITKIDGEDISGDGMGIGYKTARVRVEPGNEVVVTYTARVSENAPERLAFTSPDDGNGYLNVARTHSVKAEKPDGTEGGVEEFPEIPDKEDDANTPVQTPDEEPEENPPGPNETEYPIIWLLKNSVDDPAHILPGGTFQVLDEDGNVVLEITDTDENGFGIGFDWKEWQTVLQADKTYYLHEVTPPPGYTKAEEDVKFTVGHYGESIEAIVSNKRIPDYQFTKEDFAGKEVFGATCELLKVNPDGTTESLGRWVSTDVPKSFDGQWEIETTYRYHEELAPEGYGYSEDIEFTIGADGTITEAHYISDAGETILYDKDGYPTTIVAHPDGTYTNDGKKITIDENGNAVDENGEIHAEGVMKELVIEDNTFRMKDAPTDAFIQKTDLNGKVLSGGKFQILTADGKEVRAVRDTNIPSTEHTGNIAAGERIMFAAELAGTNITGQLKAGEDFILRELEAPTGHIVGADETFHIPYLNQKHPVQVPMKDTPTKISFTKEDFAGEEVVGANCELLEVLPDGSTKHIAKWVSGTENKVFEGALNTNTTYRYHEELAPEGYGYSEDIEFTIGADGTITEAHYINNAGETILYDKDGYPTTIVAHPDGTYTNDGKKITIDENGNAVDENGEIHAEGVAKSISVTNNVVRMKDAPTKLLFVKTDMDGNPLSGGRYQIVNPDGTAVKAIMESELFERGKELIFAADPNGVNITGQLISGQSYLLKELEAPDGYVTGNSVSFKIPYLNQKTPIKAAMKNAPTKMEIIKVDENDKAVIGAKLVVRAENGDVMDAWVTDGKARNITGKLVAGKTYTLYEEEAPAGYYKAEPVRFTVENTEKVQTVKMTDEQTEVKLVKVKKGTDEKLSGGKFSILRKSDKAVIVPEFELNGEIILTGKLEAGETYLFHEITPPAGYLKAADVEFTMSMTKPDTLLVVVMEDKKPGGGGGGSTPEPPSIEFNKYDGMTMKGLPGAEFTIYDEKGNVYKKVVTDQNGKAYVTFTTPGKYSYRETKAPDGYELDETLYEFVINKTSHLSENVANYETPPEVIIKKADYDTGEPVEGVRFEIANEEGKVVYTGTTDSYGLITFKPDQYGHYAVRETKVPNVYELSDGYITFTVKKGGVEGETTFYNHKKETPPDKPRDPDPGKKGFIDAKYDNGSDAYGKGWFDRDGNWHPFANPSKTGDFFPFLMLAGLMTCGLVGLAVVRRKKKGEENA